MPVDVDGQTVNISVRSGQVVENALSENGIELGELDRSIPPRDAALNTSITIYVIRVTEEIETVQEEIPFTTNILPNETMLFGERRIIQEGKNGIREVTYRHIIENGSEVNNSIISTTILSEPQNEIIMEGVQSPNIPVTLNGKLAYLIAGNAWMMEDSTKNRRPLVTTGDLDARVFSLSPDGEWLLYSRTAGADQSEVINNLWVINTTNASLKPINLGIQNVVSYADWVPTESRAVVYTTAEPRDTSPGWQANNDLSIVHFTLDGSVFSPTTWLESNSGGVYGWWGSNYSWNPSGKSILILQPDGMDLLTYSKKEPTHLLDIMTYQTHSNWAWTTQAEWNSDGKSVFMVNHRKDENSSSEDSPHFDLDIFSIQDGTYISLREDVGMFAYPSLSPKRSVDDQLAYLQASFPLESDTSPYRLVVMNQDGSNARELFPREGAEGMLPQQVQWQPVGGDSTDTLIAVIYLGNIWLVNVETGLLQQITGDGLTVKINWR
ncbi:MAG: G5 domain-containing protein [Anaerolineaceae bacterium]|nr:G5 domain-containing protein [Anaerolineaceae bacterium]MBN2677476.1 G5 domain-containing protein [Anaerolineaceae bacterium]